MKYQFHVHHARLDEHFHTRFEADEFNIFPAGDNDTGLQFQLVKDGEIYETFWFSDVLDYHWSVINH